MPLKKGQSRHFYRRPKKRKTSRRRTTMKHLTYTIQIHPAEEGGYWVEVPALPGCVTQGESYEEAVEMAGDAIASYIESLVKEGEPIPVEQHPPKEVAIGVNVRVPISR